MCVEVVKVDLRPLIRRRLACKDFARTTGLTKEATITHKEVFAIVPACKVEPMSPATRSVHGEAGPRAFVPLSGYITNPHVTVAGLSSDMSMDRREAFQERMKTT